MSMQIKVNVAKIDIKDFSFLRVQVLNQSQKLRCVMNQIVPPKVTYCFDINLLVQLHHFEPFHLLHHLILASPNVRQRV